MELEAGDLVISYTDGVVEATNQNGEEWTDSSSSSDQDGYGTTNDQMQQVWHYRRIDLSAFAGKTVQQVNLVTESTTAAGAWDIYYQDVALVSTDGTVQQLYNRQTSISLAVYSTSGVTGASYEINHNSGVVAVPDVSTQFYHTDHLGSARMMSSVNGYPVWQATYLPFGYEYNPQTTVNVYKFTGYEHDNESGLEYANQRHYSSQFARFMSPDPLTGSVADPQSLNRYAYSRNNPLKFKDPSGADCEWGGAGYDGGDGGCDGADWGDAAALGDIYVGDNGASLFTYSTTTGSGDGATLVNDRYDVGGSIYDSNTGQFIDTAIPSDSTTVLASVFAQANIPVQVLFGITMAEVGAAGVITVADAGAISTIADRVTVDGETFFHYGFGDQAAGFEQGLLPNSYATSIGDLSASEAQSGLSLNGPLRDAVYQVVPEPGTPLTETIGGSVPNYGQPGGLPEFNFPEGTGPGTVSPPTSIPH